MQMPSLKSMEKIKERVWKEAIVTVTAPPPSAPWELLVKRQVLLGRVSHADSISALPSLRFREALGATL